MRRVTFLAVSAVVISLVSLPENAMAQSMAGRQIRLVVPFPAGGPTDIVARPFAQMLGNTLKSVVVIDNRGGAGGSLGADAVAKSARTGDISPLQQSPGHEQVLHGLRTVAPCRYLTRLPGPLRLCEDLRIRHGQDRLPAGRGSPVRGGIDGICGREVNLTLVPDSRDIVDFGLFDTTFRAADQSLHKSVAGVCVGPTGRCPDP